MRTCATEDSIRVRVAHLQWSHVETEDRRKDYGERRVVATGIADGIHLTLVYTDRQESDEQVLRRIISAHRSNRRERTRYEEASK